MARPKIHRLGDLQLRIMKILWDRKEATVTEVFDALGARARLAYTTVATMLRKMEARGLVAHRTEGRSFVYRAAVEADAVTRGMADHLLERLFEGNLADMVNHLLTTREVSREELSKLEELIAQKKEGPMNPNAQLTLCVNLFALLAVEVAAISLIAMALQRRLGSPIWRRACWQVGVASALVITFFEISGTGRGMANWLSNIPHRQAANQPSNLHEPAGADTAETPRLDAAFREKVQARRAANEAASPATHSPPQSIPRPTTATPAASSISSEDSTPAGAPSLSTDSTGVSQTKTETPGAAPSDFTSAFWLWLVWFAGVIVVAGRVLFARGCCELFRRRRSPVTDPALMRRIIRLADALGLKRRVRVIESARLTGPIAFGLTRPTIALPPDFATRFDANRQDAMLAHELAHLAACDSFWYLLADLSTALLWWHPAAWWMRRELHAASESAADEASLLVANGPRVLAECLVELGARLARLQPLGGLGVADLRSNLGRRVQRLLHLEDNVWSPPSRIRSLLVKSFGPIALVAVVILCSAWLAPRALTQGDSMKTVQQTWKQSLATLLLAANLHSANNALGADASGGTPNTPPAGSRATPATPTVRSSDAIKHGAALEEKLKKIVLDSVIFDALPLAEVLRTLNDESVKRDGTKSGINFLINPNTPPAPPAPPIASGLPFDPTGGAQLLNLVATEAVDINTVVITIKMPLRNINMKDLLDAIVKVADRPIEYSLEDYGVVFSLKPQASYQNPPVPQAFFQVLTFKVDTNTFAAGLESAFGIKIEMPPLADGTVGARSKKIQSALRDLLVQLGIPMDSNKSVFYNELTGIVMVRGTPSDLETVKAAIETLGGAQYDPSAAIVHNGGRTTPIGR